MSNFFNATTTRIQPTRQEGVIDTLRGYVIEGYSFENNTVAPASTITISTPAVATGTAFITVTVNPAYLPFAGQNVRNLSVNIIAADSVAVQASKVRAALSADLLLSAYFNLSVTGGAVLISPKQTYEPQAYLTGLTGTLTASYILGATPIALPSGTVGRLVYTPGNATNSSLIRTIEAGATGVLRGMTAWCPDVEYNDITKANVLRPFYRHDVMSKGIMHCNGGTPVTGYANQLTGLFVYVTGVNAGRIRVGADAGALALTAANFPGLANLGSCDFSIYELSNPSSSLYKLSVEIN